MSRKVVLWIDGEKIGKLKKKKIEFSPGVHVIKIKAGKRTVTEEVTVTGEDLLIQYDHRKRKVSVALTATSKP